MQKLVSGLLLVLVSCQFIPDEDNFQKKGIPDYSNLDLTEFSEQDTLFISETKEFRISALNLENRRLFSCEVLIDGNHHSSHYSVSINFIIDPSYYSTGIHVIEVVYHVSTGSNSLADMLNAEQLVISKKWKFEVDNSPPTKLTITSTEFRDGAVHITWSPYQPKNFLKYKLVKDCCGTFETNDMTQLTVTDTTYVGGPRERIYTVSAYNNKGQYSTSDPVSYKDNTGLGVATHQHVGKVWHTTWRKNKYYNAFKSYLITTQSNSWPYFTVLQTKNDVSDTIGILDTHGIEFGSTRVIRIITVDKGFKLSEPYYINDYPAENVTIYAGTPVHRHAIVKYSQDKEAFYTVMSGNAFKLDAESLDTLAITSLGTGYNLIASANGQYVYKYNSSNIIKLNPETLQTEQTYSIASLAGSSLSIYSMSVSNANLISIGSAGSKVWLFEMNTPKLFYSGSGDPVDIRLSDDSRLFFAGRKIYEVTSTGLTLIMNLSSTYLQAFFNPNTPNEAILLDPFNNKFQIVNPWSNEVLREIITPSGNTHIKIDTKTNFGLLGSANYYSVVDLTTGNMVVNFPWSHPDTPYTLFNNKLFRNGYMIPFNEFEP